MNRQKSKIFLSNGCRNKATLANLLGVSQCSLPMKYLGPPLPMYTLGLHILQLLLIQLGGRRMVGC